MKILSIAELIRDIDLLFGFHGLCDRATGTIRLYSVLDQEAISRTEFRDTVMELYLISPFYGIIRLDEIDGSLDIIHD